MSDKDILPLDDDIRTLVEGARGIGAAPPDAKARVFAGVESAVLLGGGGGRSGGGGGQGSTRTPQRNWAQRVASGSIVFTLGGVTGAIAVHATARAPLPVERDPPQIVYVDRPAPSPTPIAPMTEPVGPPSQPGPPRAPCVTASIAAASPFAARTGVSDERVLLDGARAALEREEWGKALAATKEHERKFPNGLLVQEREAMAVRALAMLGRREDASARARRFRERFPDSLLLPALDGLVGAAPATSL